MSRFALFLTLIFSVVVLGKEEHPACSPNATCDHGSSIKCLSCENNILACPKLGLTAICERFYNQTASDFTTVELNDNAFTSFDSFPVVTNISKLLMRNNHLSFKEVTKINMGRFPQLIYLDLSHNKLEKLNEDMFEQTGLILEIILVNTSLRELPAGIFKNAKALHFLDLKNNNFTEFPCHAFLPFNRITSLSLSDNPIGELTSKHFENLGNLDHLELENTKIVVINKFTFASLSKLRDINLEHNSDLVDIDEDAFGFYSKIPGKMAQALQTVTFRGCNLRSLDQHTLNFRGLTQLGLSKNSWQCDCTIKWMSDKKMWHDAVGEVKILEELEKTTCMDLTYYGKSVLSISEAEFCSKQSAPRQRQGMMAGMTTVLLISMMILALGLILGVVGFRRFAKRPDHSQPQAGHPYRAIYNQGHVHSHEDGLPDNRQQQKDPLFEL